MTETDNPLPIIAQPEELDYALACAAYNHTSHTPERRARSDQEAYAADVNGFYADMLQICTSAEQRALLEAEILRYKENYLKLYRAYLHSHSRVASSFITGPANFPVERNAKRGRWADNKLTEFTEWRTRARTAIREKLKEARTPEEKTDAQWQALQRDIQRSLVMIESIDAGDSDYTRSAFVNSIVGKAERLANQGEAVLVEKAVACVTEYNARHKKPAITKASKFWSFVQLARENAAAQPPAETQTLHEDGQVQVLLNPDLDRLQIIFADIPDAGVRARLKSAGWHWSPQEGAWQRKLTEAAKYSARQVLGLSAFERAEPEEPAAPDPVPTIAPSEVPSAQQRKPEQARTLKFDL